MKEIAVVRDTQAASILRDIFKAYGLSAVISPDRTGNASNLRCTIPLSKHISLQILFTVETKEAPLGFAFSASSELLTSLPDTGYLGGEVSKEHYATPKQALRGLLAAFDDEILDAFHYDLENLRSYLKEGVEAMRNLTQARKALVKITRRLQEF